MFRLLLVLIAASTMLAAPGAADAERKNLHERKFKHYEGTTTCLECHDEEAESFFHSQHYQWRGETPAVVNAEGLALGKMSMINDFCTNPSGKQWIGEVKNAEGKVVAKGCSGCHAGLGKLPTQEISDEQLENIDCLMCHASGYRRDLYATDDGGWEWRPILWKNQEGLDSVSKRLSLPTRTMCLRCHSNSGGGPNYKRGDIAYLLKDPPLEFDAHMASEDHGGPDLQCVDCHASNDHRVKGRGVDLAASDAPAERLSCDGACHNKEPHAIAALDGHTDKVYCTTCHIPVFAKDDPTDMYRDWSDIKYSEKKGKYTYSIKLLEQNVVPVYAWNNGQSWLQLPSQPVRKDADGVITMAMPEGSRDDPEAMIMPFKLHGAKMPVLNDKNWILPIHTESVYVDGNVDRAVRDAGREFYGLDDIEYTWAETKRYMGIYHEVAPAKDALTCLDCHRPKGRMDWQALGYDGDPLEKLILSPNNQ